MPDTATTTETVVVERLINADQETIFEYWTQAEKIKTWLSMDAELDPREGGTAHLVMGGHATPESEPFETRGHFLAVEPHSHIEFTWGFPDPRVGVPPESSIVCVDLIPHDEGTLVRVTHKDLPAGRDDSPYSERKGWNAMLEHLAEAVAA
jgi:uncharacterized protein YndB with AHSA1/START domain